MQSRDNSIIYVVNEVEVLVKTKAIYLPEKPAELFRRAICRGFELASKGTCIPNIPRSWISLNEKLHQSRSNGGPNIEKSGPMQASNHPKTDLRASRCSRNPHDHKEN